MIYCPQIYKDQDICIVRKGNWIGEDIQLIFSIGKIAQPID